MKAKNVKYTGSPERLQELKEEVEFIGRDCELRGGVLTVFAIDRKHNKRAKRKEAKRTKGRTRDKRSEKFEKRPSKND